MENLTLHYGAARALGGPDRLEVGEPRLPDADQR